MAVVAGFPAVTETGNKAYLAASGQVLINDLTRAGWQYVDESTVVPKDRWGHYTGVISDYPAITPETTYEAQILDMVDRAYPPDIITRAKKIEWMKKRRRHLLRSCDWCIASDSPLTSAQKTTVQTYRAALRNMGDTVKAAQVDAATTKSALLALFPTRPAIVNTQM